MQPCLDLIEPLPSTPLPQAIVSDPGVPAGWFILGLVVAIAVFEVWALKNHKNTISHLIQRLSRGRKWFRWLGLLGLTILGWHIFWGFPW